MGSSIPHGTAPHVSGPTRNRIAERTVTYTNSVLYFFHFEGNKISLLPGGSADGFDGIRIQLTHPVVAKVSYLGDLDDRAVLLEDVLMSSGDRVYVTRDGITTITTLKDYVDNMSSINPLWGFVTDTIGHSCRLLSGTNIRIGPGHPKRIHSQDC